MTSSLESARPKRALVFLLYDPDGICDEATAYTVRGFRDHVDLLLVVSNGYLQPESRERLNQVADIVLERENLGYDVGAYRDALRHIGWDRLGDFDELLMVNYTFFGPVESFAPVLQRMENRDIDFWGISDHPEVTPHPYLGKGTMPRHLQSFWLAVRKPILSSPHFRQYWLDLNDPTSYEDVVVNFETAFTSHFANLGFSWEAAFPATDYGVDNPSMEAPLMLLEDGCPLFKKRLYFHDAPWLAKQGVFSGAVTAAAVTKGFPEALVVDGIHRRATTRELSFGMDATFVAPPVDHAGQAEPGSAQRNAEGLTRKLQARTVIGRPWKRLATEGVDALLEDGDVLIVDALQPERGHRRDGAFSAWKYAHDAVVKPAGHTTDLLEAHPKMAALFPYTNLLSEPVAGRQWFTRTQRAGEVADALGLVGPFSHSSVLAPYRGIAAYRRELLESVAQRITEAGGWDHLLGMTVTEDELQRTLDLLAGDIAREGGFYVGQVGTADELRRTASLLQDSYSRKPYVQPGYLDYPYSGRVIMPSVKNRIGARLKAASPQAFQALHHLEQRGRSAVRDLKGKLG